jgi:hypothetical protein
VAKFLAEGKAQNKERTLTTLRELLDAGDRCHEAVFRVEPELSNARGSWCPPHLPPVTNQTACVAAQEFRQPVLEEILMVADREGWSRVCKGEPVKMDIGKVASKFEEVRRHFREKGKGAWPDTRAMIIQIRSEVGEVARRREAAPNGIPFREDWQPATVAVAIANERGHDITLDWISKRKDRIQTRDPELPGNRKLELEMNTLAVVLFNGKGRKAKSPKGNAGADEPDETERARIQTKRRQRLRKTARTPLVLSICQTLATSPRQPRFSQGFRDLSLSKTFPWQNSVPNPSCA